MGPFRPLATITQALWIRVLPAHTGIRKGRHAIVIDPCIDSALGLLGSAHVKFMRANPGVQMLIFKVLGNRLRPIDEVSIEVDEAFGAPAHMSSPPRIDCMDQHHSNVKCLRVSTQGLHKSDLRSGTDEALRAVSTAHYDQCPSALWRSDYGNVGGQATAVGCRYIVVEVNMQYSACLDRSHLKFSSGRSVIGRETT